MLLPVVNWQEKWNSLSHEKYLKQTHIFRVSKAWKHEESCCSLAYKLNSCLGVFGGMSVLSEMHSADLKKKKKADS